MPNNTPEVRGTFHVFVTVHDFEDDSTEEVYVGMAYSLAEAQSIAGLEVLRRFREITGMRIEYV